MDDEHDAVEAFERDLFQLDADHESNSSEDEKELEDLLYSASHHACDLQSEQSLHLESNTNPINNPENTEKNDMEDHKPDEDHKSHDGETTTTRKKAPPKRYYDSVDEDKLNSGLSNKICDTCKEKGHVKRNCPNWKANILCYNCNGTGHFSRECPTKETDKISKATCYRCNQVGHLARDCPNERAEDAGAEKYKTCYKCNEVGHIARDCTNERAADAGIEKYKNCYKCNESGHIARNCNKGNEQQTSSTLTDFEDSLNEEVIRYMQSYTSTDDSCKNCGGIGHAKDVCKKYYSKFTCNNCGGVGHRPKDCPSNAATSKASVDGHLCGCCGENGHFAQDCPDATDVANRTPKKSDLEQCNESPIYKSKWNSETPLGALGTSATKGTSSLAGTSSDLGTLGVVRTSSTVRSAGVPPASDEKPIAASTWRDEPSSKSSDTHLNGDYLPLSTKATIKGRNKSKPYNDFMTKCDDAIDLLSSTEDDSKPVLLSSTEEDGGKPNAEKCTSYTDGDNMNNNKKKRKLSKEIYAKNNTGVSYSPLSDLGIDKNEVGAEKSKKKKKKKKKKLEEGEPPTKKNREVKSPIKEDKEQKPQSDWLSRCEPVLLASHENKTTEHDSVYDLSTDDELQLPERRTSNTQVQGDGAVETPTPTTPAVDDDEASQRKNASTALDHETLNNLRSILWDSADEEASDDSADIPDVLSLPSVEMEMGGVSVAKTTSDRAVGNEILMNLDSSSDSDVPEADDRNTSFEDRMKSIDVDDQYNPTEFNIEHLAAYGIHYSPSSQKVDIQPLNSAEIAKSSAFVKTKRKAKTNPRHEKSKKQKMNFPANKVKKKKGGALKSFKKNFLCSTSTSSPAKPNHNPSVKSRLKPENRGFKFREGLKKDVIVLD